MTYSKETAEVSMDLRTSRKARIITLLIVIIALLFTPERGIAAATPEPEDDNYESWFEGGDQYYTVKLESGETLFTVGTGVNVDDEYISGDNQHYVIASVDPQSMTAVAQHTGAEEMPSIDWLKAAFAQTTSISTASSASSGNRHVAIYATHTDESYVPSDGTESEDNGGGILDVAQTLKEAFEEQGVTVDINTTSHLPHDNGAYRRSRQTAAALMKSMPDALIDVHRDGIPNPDEYITTVNGENTVKVRLLVGRSNQNSAANKDFAKQIKAVADEQYPGLVKDIFIGKGSYNQDLSPRSILLEFGTHTTSKERAQKATSMIATAMTSVLYGQAANGQSGANTGAAEQQKNGGVGTGILWIVLFVVVAALAYAFLATGSGKGMIEKLKRNTSEITGGLIGKKSDEYNNRDDDSRSPQ
ncbi:MAG: stage II sporulation protein P [Oscillospiraceae bacterium]|nr:stage II sporulation protein P [Oscillospiraceae bacterium]